MACRGFENAGSQCGSRVQMVARARDGLAGREGVEGCESGRAVCQILPPGLAMLTEDPRPSYPTRAPKLQRAGTAVGSLWG